MGATVAVGGVAAANIGGAAASIVAAAADSARGEEDVVGVENVTSISWGTESLPLRPAAHEGGTPAIEANPLS